MIRCTVPDLLERCAERGYTLAEVEACIVERAGEYIAVDPEHPAYPRAPRPGHGPAVAAGPGTELKKLLAVAGIVATPDCACNARAAEMDRLGCEWVEANLSRVVGWLREEAQRRGLPFLDVAGRVLVRQAIANARAAAAAAERPPA